jgi:hypothetical protein
MTLPRRISSYGLLRDATRLTFAVLHAVNGGPTTARLCEWIGGRGGSYRPLLPDV